MIQELTELPMELSIIKTPENNQFEDSLDKTKTIIEDLLKELKKLKEILKNPLDPDHLEYFINSLEQILEKLNSEDTNVEMTKLYSLPIIAYSVPIISRSYESNDSEEFYQFIDSIGSRHQNTLSKIIEDANSVIKKGYELIKNQR